MNAVDANDQSQIAVMGNKRKYSKGRLATKPTDPLKSNDQPHGVAVN